MKRRFQEDNAGRFVVFMRQLPSPLMEPDGMQVKIFREPLNAGVPVHERALLTPTSMTNARKKRHCQLPAAWTALKTYNT